MKRSKKGISLAFVIVVVMALIIFSAMLFSAASHSMSMTGESTDGRQAYLTAKSAVEYAKSVAYDQAKNGLQNFVIGFGSDGNFQQDTNVVSTSVASHNLDGTVDCAKCWNTGGNDWKITARVKYKNSAQYRQLAYTFALTRNASVNLPASDFIACGMYYGTNNVFNNNGYFPVLGRAQPNDPVVSSSSYPVVETKMLFAHLDGRVTVPEIFLLSDSDIQENSLDRGHYSLRVDHGNGKAEIHSDSIYIGYDVFTPSPNDSPNVAMNLYPSTQGASGGIIYFAGNNGGSCLIKRGEDEVPPNAKTNISKGYYSFDAGFDLASIVPDPQSGSTFLDNYGKQGAKKMTKVSETAASRTFRQDIAYINSKYVDHQYKILSGVEWGTYYGANFTSGGVFAGGSLSPGNLEGSHWHILASGSNYNLDECTVFTYATAVGWPPSAVWPQYSNGYGAPPTYYPVRSVDHSIYCAKQFFLRFVNDSQNFVLPSTFNVVFHSDLVSLSMAASDGEAGADPGKSGPHRPEIVQTQPGTSFLLTSLNGTDKVTLAVQNAVQVVLSGGSYVIPSGTYSVPSGFNFFEDKTDWGSFWSSCKTGDYPVPGSGGSGGSGTFTITPGNYTGS